MTALLGLPTSIQYDLNDLFVGDEIGHGTFRNVYRAAQMPGHVVKIEKPDSGEFANVTEWKIWNAVKGTRLEPYFCPCVTISPSGNVLIMKYAKSVPKGRWPKELPEILSDVRDANIGLYKGRFVVIDYGRHGFFDLAIKKARLLDPVRCDWRYVPVPVPKNAQG